MKRIAWPLSAVLLFAAAAPAADWPTLDVNALVREARRTGKNTLTLPPGIHRTGTVSLDRLDGFTLDGNGATLVFGGNVRSFLIRNGKNLTLKNVTVDYDPLPFTQATVVAVAADAREATLRLHDGYPDLFRRQNLNLQVYDPATRLLKREGGDLFGGSVVADAGPRTYTLKFGRQPADILAPGDLVAIDWRTANGIDLESVDGAVLENITLLASPNAGVMARFVAGDQVIRGLTIKRSERLPAGATEPRLLSVVADAINYAYCERGPLVEDCDISFQGDDAVNFHGASLAVLRQEAPDTLVVFTYHNLKKLVDIVRPGMAVRILREPAFEIYHEGKVESLTHLPGEKIDYDLLRRRFPRAVSREYAENGQAAFRLKLTAPVTLREGLSSAELPAVAGGGYVIRNNYFHDHRAFGLRLMAGDGLVENNRFERIMKAAISVGPEYFPWREAGWADNVVIRNNRLRDLCTEPRSALPDSGAVGAVILRAGLAEGVDARHAGNGNIVIEGNEIDGCRVAAVYLDNTRGAVVRGNTIRNVLTDPRYPTAGSRSGWTIEGPVTVAASCRDVVLD